MFEIILQIVLFIIIAGLIMVVTEYIYTVSFAIVPLVAIILIVVACVVGLVIAIKNTFLVYKRVYGKYIKKGKQQWKNF